MFKKKFILLLSVLFCAFDLSAQNNIFLSNEKIVNTEIFNLNCDINKNIFGGAFSLSQKYRGASEQSLTFREEESLLFKYYSPIKDNLNIITNNSFFLTNDSKSIGINKSQNIQSNLGLFQKNGNSSLETGISFKDMSQIGKKTSGAGLYLSGDINNYSLDEFQISGSILGEKYWLNNERDLSDINLNFKTFSDPNLKDNFELDVKYRRQYKDFYSPISDGVSLLETRFEKRYSIGAALNYGVFKSIKVFANARIENIDLARAFNSMDSIAIQTKVFRNLSAQQLLINLRANIELDNLNATIGLASESKNENNAVNKKFDLSEADINNFRSLEEQRDNQTEANRLFFQGFLVVNNKDSIYSNFSAQTSRYDTPSELNLDDRDEASFLGNIAYKKVFNENLNAKISLDFSARHLVFLKASRSAQNKWDRFIRLSEIIEIKTKNIVYTPEFEIFANYSSFDYEKTITNAQSFSFRQLGYKDYLKINLSENYYFEISNNLRYFQRASFYWSDFSESPESFNFETYNKISICNRFLLNCLNSIGIRYYSFSKKSAQNILSAIANSDENRYSIAPEAKLIYSASENSNIMINAWYEFQYFNNQLRQKIPNFLIQINYRI